MNIIARTGILLVTLAVLPLTASARYESSSDTGAGKLDYIENVRRDIRYNTPTPEQKKLLGDIDKMKKTLRKPVDEDTIPVPTTFEGDYLTYNQNTGEFIARGKVHITQIDGHSFDSEEEATGNTLRQEINIPGKARVLQYPVGGEVTTKVTLDGYHTFYNYGAKMGTMESAKGKVGDQYVTGKKFEFYPNRVVVYDGTATKCPAEKPDYHESAEKIVIWPNDRMYLYNAKVWVGKVLLYKKKYIEKDISPDADNPQYPKVGYSKSDGAWIKQEVRHNIDKNFDLVGNLYASTKHGVRSNGEFVFHQPKYYLKAVYGFYEDSDDNWLQRAPALIGRYSDHFGASPFWYAFDAEIGKWKKPKVQSTHKYYKVSLGRDAITLPGRYYLFVDVGYSVTHESYDSSKNKGFEWNTTLMKNFDDKWAAYAGYYYNHVNAENALFNFNLADYAKRIEAGLSYRMDKNDRFVAGYSYDCKKKTLRDIDYYWFRDLHCSQLIVRYRVKRHSWNVSWEFTPW